MAITGRIPINVYDDYEVSVALSFTLAADAADPGIVVVNDYPLRVFSNWEALDARIEGFVSSSVFTPGNPAATPAIPAAYDLSLQWKDKLPKKIEFSPLSQLEDHVLRYKENPSYALRSPYRELAMAEDLTKLFYKAAKSIKGAADAKTAAYDVLLMLADMGIIVGGSLGEFLTSSTDGSVSLVLRHGLHPVLNLYFGSPDVDTLIGLFG